MYTDLFIDRYVYIENIFVDERVNKSVHIYKPHSYCAVFTISSF